MLLQVLTETQTVVFEYEGTNMTFTVTGVTILDKMNGQVKACPTHFIRAFVLLLFLCCFAYLFCRMADLCLCSLLHRAPLRFLCLPKFRNASETASLARVANLPGMTCCMGEYQVLYQCRHSVLLSGLDSSMSPCCSGLAFFQSLLQQSCKHGNQSKIQQRELARQCSRPGLEADCI